jgi:hypothetical protein
VGRREKAEFAKGRLRGHNLRLTFPKDPIPNVRPSLYGPILTGSEWLLMEALAAEAMGSGLGRERRR